MSSSSFSRVAGGSYRDGSAVAAASGYDDGYNHSQAGVVVGAGRHGSYAEAHVDKGAYSATTVENSMLGECPLRKLILSGDVKAVQTALRHYPLNPSLAAVQRLTEAAEESPQMAALFFKALSILKNQPAWPLWRVGEKNDTIIMYLIRNALLFGDICHGDNKRTLKTVQALHLLLVNGGARTVNDCNNEGINALDLMRQRANENLAITALLLAYGASPIKTKDNKNADHMQAKAVANFEEMSNDASGNGHRATEIAIYERALKETYAAYLWALQVLETERTRRNKKCTIM